MLAPKVTGTLALETVLMDEAVDFICHFSSSSAILGDFGACAYAVANRFQMVRAAATDRAVAINWPLWTAGGMGLGSSSAAALYLG
ncbi:KR domain-containing protein, partial [Mycobacterium tuberculosis]|uniref:KR domain-containing protein n=1 Tax=Mycobacterium tuberculosis TaxID=1773 RepID=UPI001AE16420|nr:KR domain-containing protein [Mycobacterium tuberculosis]